MKWGTPVMMFNRFFFNRGLWSHTLKQSAWLGILYFLVLLLSILISLNMLNDSYKNQRFHFVVSYFAEIGAGWPNVAMLIISILMGLLLTRYIQNKASVDFFHSLPLKRVHLLTTHFAVGVIALTIPLWIMAIIAAILSRQFEYVDFTAMQVLEWTIATNVLSLFLFSLTVFVGICIGQTILQGIVVAILLTLTVAIPKVWNKHLDIYLFGYSSRNQQNLNEDWSPLFNIMNASAKIITTLETCLYLLIAIILIVLSYLFYKIRATEKTTHAVTFTYFNPLFRVGVMFCGALFAGALSVSFLNDWTPIAYIVGAIVAYTIAEMIIRKSWNIYHMGFVKGMLGHGVVVALLLYIPVSNYVHYEAEIPSAEEIAGVYEGGNLSYYLFENEGYVTFPRVIRPGVLSSDPNYIQLVRNLHMQIEQIRPKVDKLQQFTSDYKSVDIGYKLKDGSLIVRSYQVPSNAPEYQYYLAKIQQSPSYKIAVYNLPSLDHVSKPIEIVNLDRQEHKIQVSNKKDIKELIQLIKKEKLAIDNPDASLPNSSLYFSVESDLISYETSQSYYWDSSYKPLAIWLKKKGYWDQIITKPTDLNAIIVVRDNRTKAEKDTTSDQSLFTNAYNTDKEFVAKDKKMMGILLDASENIFDYNNASYYLKLKFKDGTITYRHLVQSQVTSELSKVLPE